MGSFFKILSYIPIILIAGFSGLSSCTDYLYPNFTATYLQFVDVGGVFLSSINGTYKAGMYNPENQNTNFYLCIIHDESNTVIWSANRDNPVSNSGMFSLTPDGILITDENSSKKWSTPKLASLASSLHLNETGNLMLFDHNNISIWESFRYPTDTIVIGQHLPVGNFLTSPGNYSLSVTTSDAVLQWGGSVYWRLSMSLNAFANANREVEYLELNQTGLYLIGGSVVVVWVDLPSSAFRIAKLDSSGQLIIFSWSGTDLDQDFVGPNDKCEIPFICGKVGLCTDSSVSGNNPLCSCPSNFRNDPDGAKACVPNNSSLSFPSACNSSENLSYVTLGFGIDYFAVKFLNPMRYGVGLSTCQSFCSLNCSCLGVFFKNSTGSCFLINNQLGSVISKTSDGNEISGYIKAEVVLKHGSTNTNGENSRRIFPLIAAVIFPFTLFAMVSILGFVWWRKWRRSRLVKEKVGDLSSTSEEDDDGDDSESFNIPGLPIRYQYNELKAATENFRTQIGSGGFGSVYKGMLKDKSMVAVKKITNLGDQGRTEFCTEIAIIGNVHHANLVKLKGFCAQGRERLLVYEYMNRGSLDRTLFGSSPALEWQERFEIALGTARALAYLHSGCERKIIHCDVKPENILLHEQFFPKISDFGLSKLLSREQSSHFTTMRGTRGYLAPEWLTSSAISDRTDVYSYGMVALELISGRKNCFPRMHSHSLDGNIGSSGGDHSVSSSGFGQVYFPMLALEMHERGRYAELADPRLEGRVSEEEVGKLVRVALCCVHEEPMLRPTMTSVVGMLEGRVPLGEPRLDLLNFLRFYGHRFAEASTVGDGGEGGGSGGFYQQGSVASSRSYSPASASFLSSQQISGPR